jgi:hypothetical protein
MGVKRQRSRRPGQRSTATPSTAATKAVLIGFDRWYTRHLAVDGHDHQPADQSLALLTELFERSRGALHRPEAPVLEELLASVDADPQAAKRLPEVIDVLEHYLDFAVETEVWRAADAQIDESTEVLEVAFELSTGLLLYLLDALDEVEDVPAPLSRSAFAGLSPLIRTPADLLARLRSALGADADADAPAEVPVPQALAVERVIGLLCVAADPGLLPDRSEERIRSMLDTAAGVTADEAREADALTDRILAELEADGILRSTVEGSGGSDASDVVRREAPVGLRPDLADAVLEIADELGLLDDDAVNPHPVGAALQVKIAVLDSRPAEWRRLVLAADSDLGELHLATQLALDWANDDPHEFTVEGEPGTVFTSVDGMSDDPGATGANENAVEENGVQVGELLVDVGDELRYRYGAASPRLLVMRLESVVEADPRPLPRCVGASDGVDVAETDRLLAPLRLR